MSKKIDTCGKCPFVRKFNIGGRRPFWSGSCGHEGPTNNTVIPHQSNGDDVITFTRIPEACPRPRTEVDSHKAPWAAKKPDVIKLINIEEIT